MAVSMFVRLLKFEDFKFIADEVDLSNLCFKDNGCQISFNNYDAISDNCFYEVEEHLHNGNFKLKNYDFIVPENAVEKISYS